MTAIFDRIRNEPALVTGVVSALIALGVSFGLDLSGEQTGAIMAAVAAVMALVVRQQVTPVNRTIDPDDLDDLDNHLL